MKESGTSKHDAGSYHTGQTVKSWSAMSPSQNVQGERRDSAEAKAWRKEERKQKIKERVTKRRKEAKGKKWWLSVIRKFISKVTKSFLLK